MGRDRKIEVDDVLDATERVIARVGLAGLSIDAVAKEAGISKSRVVYDHKSKVELLDALVVRKLNACHDKVRDAVASCQNTEHPELFGRIAIAEDAITKDSRLMIATISAAASNREVFRSRLRQRSAEDLRAITADTARPRAALMAYLALVGFYTTVSMDRQDWDGQDCKQILDDIRSIFASFPEPDQPS